VTTSISPLGYVQNIGGLTASMVTTSITPAGAVQNVGGTTASSVLFVDATEIHQIGTAGTHVRADKIFYVGGATSLEDRKPAAAGATVGATWGVNITSQPTFIYNEVPAGLINGVNTIYTLANPYTALSVRVYLNGLRQTITIDYTETVFLLNQITFVVAPPLLSELIVDYIHP